MVVHIFVLYFVFANYILKNTVDMLLIYLIPYCVILKRFPSFAARNCFNEYLCIFIILKMFICRINCYMYNCDIYFKYILLVCHLSFDFMVFFAMNHFLCII